MSLRGRVMYALGASREAWQQYDKDIPGQRFEDRYAERWAMFDGTAFSEPLRRSVARSHPGIYRNTKLLWKHVEGVANFYATTVYFGDLSTDGEPLPDGSLGAIPIDPQVGGNAEREKALRVGIAELWAAWNWRQHMTLRPFFGSILGDCLTEIVDDVDHNMVYPSIVWPGYVKEIEIDFVGNVKRYVLEYKVTEQDRTGQTTTYDFRKEVDGEAFRYFRDDKPYDQYGDGAVVPNPYGFVPAVWDRHRIGWTERGISAIDGTRTAVAELNSLLSHAVDYQHKQFYAPILIKGKVLRPGQTQVELSKPPKGATLNTNGDPDRSWFASTFDLLPASENADLVQPVFDIGKTDLMIERLQQGILSENPEASFYHDLREMRELSGPGAERALGDAVGRAKLARSSYDPGTIKINQMSLAIGGLRANDGTWATGPDGRRRPLTRRQSVFLPFDLNSFKAGHMDFGIRERAVIPETESERLDIIMRQERLLTTWGYSQIGIEETEARRIIKERQDSEAIGAF